MKDDSEEDSQYEDDPKGNIKPGTCQIRAVHASDYTRPANREDRLFSGSARAIVPGMASLRVIAYAPFVLLIACTATIGILLP